MAAPNNQRRNLVFGMSVAIGLILGMLIKKVTLGLVIGLALGMLASTTRGRPRE